MKRFFALSIVLMFSFAPAFALAGSIVPLGQTPLQALTTLAALQAQASSVSSQQALACAALSSEQRVKVGEPVILAWGSVGSSQADAPAGKATWTQNGAQEVSLGQTGTWTYYFTFYGPASASITCSVQIVVQ